MTQNKLIVALLILLTAVIVGAQRPQSPPYSITIDERVARLEAKVEELEAQVEELSEKETTVVVKQDSWVKDRNGNLRNMTAENERYNWEGKLKLMEQERLAKQKEAEIQKIMTEQGFDRAKAEKYYEHQKQIEAIKAAKEKDRQAQIGGRNRSPDTSLRIPVRGGR